MWAWNADEIVDSNSTYHLLGINFDLCLIYMNSNNASGPPPSGRGRQLFLKLSSPVRHYMNVRTAQTPTRSECGDVM